MTDIDDLVLRVLPQPFGAAYQQRVADEKAAREKAKRHLIDAVSNMMEELAGALRYEYTAKDHIRAARAYLDAAEKAALVLSPDDDPPEAA